MEQTGGSNTSSVMAIAMLSAIAAAVACVGVLYLMGVEPKPAVVGGVVGAVVASTVTTTMGRKGRS